MPYMVRPRRFPSSALATCVALLVLGAGSAQAAKSKESSLLTLTQASQCVEPTLTQPFLYEGDSHYYTLTPGQAPDNFGGSGWVLSGGASIKKTTLQDGSTGSVLDLPSGAKAVSPNFCITSEYPTARPVVRNVVGSSGVFFYVSYFGTSTWEDPKNTGQFHGSGSQWTVPPPINMQPENVLGWQIVRLTLVGGGTTSDYQLYNLYIDPYRR
jgi:hypothetical protein